MLVFIRAELPFHTEAYSSQGLQTVVIGYLGRIHLDRVTQRG